MPAYAELPGELLLAGTKEGLHMLESNGGREKWRKMPTLLDRMSVSSLALDSVSKEIYVGLFDKRGVLRISYPRTGSRILSSGLQDKEVWTVVTQSSNESIKLYVGAEPAAIYVSEDNGMRWKELSGLYKLPSYRGWHSPWGDADLNSIAIDPTEPQRLYVGVEQGGVSKTENGGEAWIQADEGVHPDIHHLVLHPAKPSYLYAATGGGVYVSDSAEVWRDVTNGLKHSYVRTMTLHPRKPEIFYVAPMRGPYGGDLRIYRTSDRGATWEELKRGLSERMNTLAERKAFICDNEDPVGLYIGTGDGRIFASSDEGDTWNLIAEDMPAIQCLLLVH